MRDFLLVHITLLQAPSPLSSIICIEWLPRKCPFEGVMGFSEGSNVAATFLAEDIRRCKLEGTKSMFKAAVFFCGSSPLSGLRKIPCF